jgi:GDPmannose 4,6-dehydratase
LQQDTPDDYVIATGVTTTIRDFIRMSGEEVGIEISFVGEGVAEKGIITAVDEAKFCKTVGECFLGKYRSTCKTKGTNCGS